MPSSYTGDPSTSTKDQVRFLSKDTGPDTFLNSDEEIDWLLTEADNNPYLAAIEAVRGIITTHAGSGESKTVGDLSLSFNGRVTNYSNVLSSLQALAARKMAASPWAGEVYVADKEADRDNDALVQPTFARGRMDNIGTAPENNEFDRLVP